MSCLVVALLGGLATSGARGQATAEAGVVEVVGHYGTGIGASDAASEGVATARRIETRPVLRTSEILELTPGLIAGQHSGDGKAPQYFLRGFNLDHGTDLAIAVAGTPVNMPSHAHAQGYADLSFIIPELISGLSYRKGPYFAENGDFASAGSVTMRYADALPHQAATVTAGSFGYRRAVFTGGPTVAAGHLVYGLDVLRNDGPWDVPGDLKKLSAVLRYAHGDAAEGGSVTFMGYKGSWNSTDQIPERAVTAGELSRFGAIDPTDGGRASRYSLSASRHGNFAGARWEADAFVIHSRLNLFSDFTYFLDRPVDGDQIEQADRRTIYGIHPRISFASTVGGRDVVVRAGLQGRFDDIAQVALFDDVARGRTRVVGDDTVAQSSIGVYADSTVQWADWLRTITGARIDAYRFDVRSSVPLNSGKVTDHIVSPKFAAVLGPWAKTEFFVNAGQGFHSNDARGAVLRVDPRDPSMPVQPVTALVKSRGAELGVRTEFVSGLQSSLSLWRLDLDSELRFIGDAGTTEPSRPTQREGIELSNHYRAGEAWLVDLQYAASRAKYATDPLEEGTHVEGSVQRVVSLGLTYAPGERWLAALQWRYFGPRPLVADGSVYSRSTSLVNVRFGYRIDAVWSARLDVFNLFNRAANDIDYYYPSCIPSDGAGCPAAGGVSDRHFHPVEPFAVRVSVSASF